VRVDAEEWVKIAEECGEKRRKNQSQRQEDKPKPWRFNNRPTEKQGVETKRATEIQGGHGSSFY
jgi:hypothetical protein